MKVTSEQLLDLFGLKVGDKVEVEVDETVYEVKEHDDNDSIMLLDLRWNVFYFLGCLQDKEYEIIKPKPALTEDEKVILRNIKRTQIARDEDGDIVLGEHLNKASRGCWVESHPECDGQDYLYALNHLFNFIKWEDEEPYNIKELLEQ